MADNIASLIFEAVYGPYFASKGPVVLASILSLRFIAIVVYLLIFHHDIVSVPTVVTLFAG